MNILAYLIYFAITYIITVQVGLRFYRNGSIFLHGLIPHDTTLCEAINNILLVGYYLVNIGYATLMIIFWGTIHNWTEMLSVITGSTGFIILSLGVLHCFNMLTIYFISKRNQLFHPIK
ncbi:hypothetical protein [Chitinophaga flava]|uniref:Uncharacterized protein n=1 Tax=Chitinophaga flava TaxID=2259036 RepID=A0A365XVA4_9BACT|nr:hypothetical protein [Chitinophaga flava]RBL90296.1 hypothetical protein DF182_27920 [Chitinophaga flava]